MKWNLKLTKAAVLALLLLGAPLAGCSTDNDSVTGPGVDTEPPPGIDVIDDFNGDAHSEDKLRPERPDTGLDDGQ